MLYGHQIQRPVPFVGLPWCKTTFEPFKRLLRLFLLQQQQHQQKQKNLDEKEEGEEGEEGENDNPTITRILFHPQK